MTVAAFLLVLAALVTPDEYARLTPGAFARIPVEGVLGVALILVVPERARRWVAVTAGAVLGVLFVLKVLDIGFDAVLVRPFDLVLDWPMLAPGVEFVKESAGQAGAIGAVVLVAVLTVGVIVLMALSSLRLSRVAVRHRRPAAWGAGVLGTVWLVCAALGAQFVEDVPVASRSAAVLAYDHTRQVRDSLNDKEEFAKAAAVDKFRTTPDDKLLTGLRGKDVLLAFVESYGRSAVESPEYAPHVDPVLDQGTQRLAKAGFSARSGWLTSSTAGGGSWLAHATLLSGLWVNNQQRYRTLVNSDRMTLNGAFRRADARTVALMPGDYPRVAGGEVLRLRQGLRQPEPRVPGAALQLRHDARPVHAVDAPAHRAGEEGPRARDGGDGAGVEPRAMGVHPAAHPLGPGRGRLGLQRDGQGLRRAVAGGRADPHGVPQVDRVHAQHARLVRGDLRRR
ncbi:hypothetical protein LUX57_08660 [Actinomadura madurae]|uniref:hypothetical protein n=1 Tax=Actinomadura madurae TaxID=1993 RepID=UPI0020D2446B|nr:hypothetical protein [Actinomadura madurae]MCP9965200.1 hypothetical protein [Actinomadura madurae]